MCSYGTSIGEHGLSGLLLGIVGCCCGSRRVERFGTIVVSIRAYTQTRALTPRSSPLGTEVQRRVECGCHVCVQVQVRMRRSERTDAWHAMPLLLSSRVGAAHPRRRAQRKQRRVSGGRWGKQLSTTASEQGHKSQVSKQGASAIKRAKQQGIQSPHQSAIC